MLVQYFRRFRRSYTLCRIIYNNRSHFCLELFRPSRCIQHEHTKSVAAQKWETWTDSVFCQPGIVAQLAVVGVQVFGKALMQASRQAIRSAQGKLELSVKADSEYVCVQTHKQQSQRAQVHRPSVLQRMPSQDNIAWLSTKLATF